MDDDRSNVPAELGAQAPVPLSGSGTGPAPVPAPAAAPASATEPAPAAAPAPQADRVKRPIIERLGLALVALVLGSLFGAVAAAAWVGGELFLAAMGAIGCLMTIWVAGLTLFRG
jgi:hypothetical protein